MKPIFLITLALVAWYSVFIIFYGNFNPQLWEVDGKFLFCVGYVIIWIASIAYFILETNTKNK